MTTLRHPYCLKFFPRSENAKVFFVYNEKNTTCSQFLEIWNIKLRTTTHLNFQPWFMCRWWWCLPALDPPFWHHEVGMSPWSKKEKRPSVDATETCGAKKWWVTSTWIMLVYCLVNGKHSWLETSYFPIGNTFSKGPLFTFLYQAVILSML